MTTVVEFPDRRVVTEEAAAWLIQLDGETPLTHAELQALGEWLHRSPAHREELERLAALWDRMNVLTELAVPLGNAGRSRRGLTSRPSHARIGLVTATAAVALIAASIGIVRWWSEKSYLATNGLYATAIGQLKTAALADGSQVVLNTNSQVKVEYTEEFRDVRLVQGEALFTVAKNPARPFRVHAGHRRIEALGTAFSVYLQGGEVSVTVTEGQVSLASITSPQVAAGQGGEQREAAVKSLTVLHAGQVATIRGVAADDVPANAAALTTIEPVAPEALTQRLAWRDGVLIFSGETLEHAVRELSRYTTVTIEIPDAAVRNMLIGGRFPVGETEAMLTALETNFDLRVTRLDHNRVVLSAADAR